MNFTELQSSRRTAVVIFGILFATTLTQAVLYRKLWFLGILVSLTIWVAALLIVAMKAGEVLRTDLSRRLKAYGVSLLLLAIALPLASSLFGFGRQIEASAFLMLHRSEMMDAEQRAMGGRPAKIDFVQGIPDGGQAIIRWNRKPTELSQSEQVSLTGERIKGCRRIVPHAWLCSYD